MIHDWYLDALCAQVDPELFYPEQGSGGQKAMRVCAQCPVIAECLDFAIKSRERHGIWGGTTPNQRLAMIRQDQPDFVWEMTIIGDDEHGRGGSWGSRTTCSRGHELIPENIVQYGDGNRRCKKCKNLHNQRRRLRRRHEQANAERSA